MHAVILSDLHKARIDETFTKRSSTVFNNVLFGNESIVWPDVRAKLKAAKPFVASCNLKTWTNGWTTSSRMTEPEKKMCLFGCTPSTRQMNNFIYNDAARDDTAHYLACPRLWSELGFPNCDALLSPIARCGLLPSSRKQLVFIAEAFVVYHTIKHGPVTASLDERMTAARRIAHVKCN